ncbi:ferric reductase-like transmembrane domain-containing protein [Patescibacteria group bacterium]|nr:ferric reductase-like transmembrane domain-containing protein [Patescibacteria group bacterium]
MTLNRKIKSYFSLLVLGLLILMPVFILYSNVPFNKVFWPWTVLFTSLGKLTGLIGLSTFAFALLLSARFVWLDKIFNGLPKVLNIHRYLGTISFTFIILHPLFLAFRLLPVSNQASLGIFLYWTEAAYIFGYTAMLIFMFLIVMTFFWRMRYERLKSLHSLLAVPLMIGGVHALLIDSDVKRISGLAWYYIILITISVLAYLLRLFLIEYKIKARPFVVESVEAPTKNTIKVLLKPSKKVLACEPGQFIFVSFDDIDKKEEHPFSIASILPDGRLAIIAKELGDYTSKMSKLKLGSRAMVDGPYGTFGQNADKSRRQVWIAGGIGITPFISMAKDFTSCPDEKGQVDLFYVVASPDDLVDADYLAQIQSNCPNFKITTHVSGQEGRFDVDKLKSFIRDFNSCDFFICGPTNMIEYFVNSLRKESVPKKSINIEAFRLL